MIRDKLLYLPPDIMDIKTICKIQLLKNKNNLKNN